MSETTNNIPSAANKAVRKDLRIIPVMAFKPPCVVEPVEPNDKATPILVYVDDKGTERRIKSTPAIWRTVDGNPGPGRRSAGFDGRDGKKRYWLYSRGSAPNDEAVSYTEFPHPDYFYNRATGVPELEPEDLLLQIDYSTGSIKVLQVPVGARPPQVEAVVRAIDAVSSLEPGQVLVAGSEILTVTGNRVTCSLPVVEERGVGRSMVPG